MKFREASIEIVRNGRGYKTPKLKAFLDEFVASGMECAEVDTDGYSCTNSAYSAVSNAIKRFHMDSIGASVRNNKLYVFQKGAMR